MSQLEKQLQASVNYYAQRNLRAGKFNEDHVAEFRRGKPMSEAIVKAENGNGRDVGALIESVVIHGDLSQLKPTERAQYYTRVCESLGLNPLTRPFEYLKLNNKEVLYAKRDCTDQLRSNRRVSVVIACRETIGDVYVVTARASTPDGRTDESTGAVSIKGLTGENLANAMMKAETKAKRRVTLSICGMGFLDETEVDSIPGALPRIAPYGELAEGVEALTNADEVVAGIEAATTKDELVRAWAGDVSVWERYDEADRKRIGYAAQRKLRALNKPAKAIDEQAAHAAAKEEDL